MSYYTYVIYSDKYRKIYIGFTKNLNERLLDHNVRAKKGYTQKYRPWRFIYMEEFDTEKEARTREKQLKSAKGREFIRSNIIDYLKSPD